MIWTLRALLYLLISYSQWLQIVDFILTLGIMILIAIAIFKSIQQHRKGGFSNVGKERKTPVN